MPLQIMKVRILHACFCKNGVHDPDFFQFSRAVSAFCVPCLSKTSICARSIIDIGKIVDYNVVMLDFFVTLWRLIYDSIQYIYK